MLDRKQLANLEMEKLSKNGLELLEQFRKDIRDPKKPIAKVVITTMLYRFPSQAAVAAKAWMACHDASESDIVSVGKIVTYTGLWGHWSDF